MPEYSSSSATPTSRCCTALKKDNWHIATATKPNAKIERAAARTSCQRPRSARTAGTVSSTAAMTMRNVTTAPGVQPVAMSESAKVPDVPNVAAENSARPSPSAPCDPS